MQRSHFIADFNLSNAQIEKFDVYHGLLLKWQKAINLVGPSTLNTSWARHFYDSAQISKYICTGQGVADLGAGAGFPGLVLAILRPDLKLFCIERDERKSQFLKNVSRETSLSNVTIFDSDVIDIQDKVLPDLVTARALASIKDLLGLCEGWRKESETLSFLFLKGEQAEAEIKDARTLYHFEYDFYPSATYAGAHIVQIRNLKAAFSE